jgi:hypothetical protein
MLAAILSSCLLSKNLKFKMYRTTVLPVHLHGSETWSLTLRVSENWVLRRIFGPEREKVSGGCRRLHNEELHNLHIFPCIIRLIKPRGVKLVRACSTHGKNKKCVQSFCRKT